MPLNENIKQQVTRIAENNQSDIDLSDQVFLDGDLAELVDLLNQFSSVVHVNLSRNILDRQDICALTHLKYVKKLTLIMSDVTYADALILCGNENFEELVLDFRALGKGSLDQFRAITRTNPLTILVTRGIEIKEFKALDITIKLGPQAEVTAIANSEIVENIQTVDEKNRKKNNSDESTASKETAPISVSSTASEKNSLLSCCPLSFCWSSHNANTAASATTANKL